MISRTVIGKPDEQPNVGYLSTHALLPADHLLSNYVEDEFNMMVNIAYWKTLDSEPDEFYYNFNGHSGKFVLSGIDDEGFVIPHLIPYSNIKIIAGAGLASFEAITEDGTKYIFGRYDPAYLIDPEFDSTQSADPIEKTIAESTCCGQSSFTSLFNSSWLLTTIISAGGEVINFEYEPYYESYWSGTSETQVTPNTTLTLCEESFCDCYSYIDVLGYRLKSIRSGNCIVEFKNEFNRDDLTDSKALSKIEINSVEFLNHEEVVQYQKGFNLSYDYYVGTGSTTMPDAKKRLRLTAVTEESKEGTLLPPTKMIYNETPIAIRDSKGQDYWGYYNGKNSNQTLIPAEEEDCFLFDDTRSTVPEFTQAGIITEIQYPTGGSLEFEYEVNDYGESSTGAIVNDYEKENTSAFAYVATDATTSKVVQFSIDHDQYAEMVIDYTYPCNCDIFYQIKKVETNQEITANKGTSCNYLTAGNYTIEAQITGNVNFHHYISVHINFRKFTGTVLKSKLASGLRIKSITSRATAGTTDISDQVIQYRYQLSSDAERSSGVLISKMKMEYPFTSFAYDEIGYRTECNFLNRSSISHAAISSANGNIVSYREVKVIQGASITGAAVENGEYGYTLHKFSYAPNNGDFIFPFAMPLSPDWKRGLELEQSEYDKNNVLVAKTTNEWDVDDQVNNYSEIWGIKVSQNQSDPSTGPTFNNGAPQNLFAAEAYLYVSQWIRLSKSTQVSYFYDGSSVSNTTNYYYDNPAHTQLTRKVTTRSDGITEVILKRFPLDYNISGYTGSDPMLISLDTMINRKRMINNVIEELTCIFKNKSTIKSTNINGSIKPMGSILNGSIINSSANSTGVIQNGAKGIVAQDTLIVSGSLFRYRMDGQNVVMDTVFRLDLKEPALMSSFTLSKSSNNTFRHDARYRSTQKFDYYNEKAQPIQFHEPYGKATAVIYESKSGMVSAVFNNAPISSVAYTGFENDNQSQFVFSPANVGIENVSGPVTRTIAGNRYYKAGTVSLAVSLPGKYVFSYWATATVSLTGNEFTVIRSYAGETIYGFTFYEYIVAFNNPGTIAISCGGAMDELRFYPHEATVTSYSYSPAGAISEILDENNYLSYFKYDGYSRLQYAEDHFGNGINYTDYHYRSSNNPSDQNYVRTEVATVPGLSASSLATATLPSAQSRRSFTFVDGLARPIQQLKVGQSPSGKDVVTHLEYDAYGRQPKTYLPFTTSQSPGQYKSNAKADQLNFYSAGLECEQTAFPYKETSYENTPSGRTRKEANPGETWKLGNHNIGYNYRGNYANEVRLFTTNAGVAGWKGTTFYAAGTLTVTETTDENENLQITYFDNKGRVVLEKRPRNVSTGGGQKEFIFTSTYFIYDDIGRLVVVISPEGFNQLVYEGNFSVSASYDHWNYFYNYNKRGFISAKKLPGIDWSYIVYDQLNRAALTQDPNQSISGNWSYQKFDVSGRSIITGLVTLAGKTPSQLQDELWLSTAVCSESRSESVDGYTNLSFPTTSLEKLTLVYYDDYDFNRDGNADFSPVSGNVARARNRTTGIYTKVLGSMPELFEKLDYFYDYKGRVVETNGSNHEGKEETELFTYNFEGAVLESNRIHHFTYYPPGEGLGYSADLIRKVRNEYDHAARLKNTWFQVDEQPEIWTSSNTYNELSQLLTLRLHNRISGTGNIPVQKAAQTLNFRYNVRGWLTSINDLEDVKERGDYWGMELHYDDGYPLISAPSQFSGNVSWMAWKSSMDEATRVYGYTYDPINRLQKAVYATLAGPGITEADQYTVDELSYDDNGNIKTMRVHGALTYDEETKVFTYGVNDDLSYTYNGNQLVAVSDAGSLVAWNNSSDFKDIANATDYSYDGNGNLVADANKTITVNYNHLNLPSLIHKPSEELKITYSSDGIKQKEEITENLQQKTTGYFGDIIHENGKPGRILFDNGYLLLDTLGNWKPYYFIKDHLGNVRVVFKGDDIDWVTSKLTFELNADEEGTEFPKFTHVSAVRDNEIALQGESSGKLNNTEGPYTEIPVNSGDTLEVSLYYFYAEEHQQKASPAKTDREHPLPAALNLELKPWTIKPPPNDLHYTLNKPVYGLQLNIVGLFEAFYTKKRNPGSAPPNDLTSDTPEAYLELSLRDTSGEEVNQWRLEVDNANSWTRLTDSIGIHVPDTLQQYTLRVSLHNESECDTWFDTLFLKLGQTGNPIIQVNHYYPYGNIIADISWQEENSDTNNYLYNGKEFHRSLNLNWFDYGARWYDPQVGRWWVVDPFGEIGKSWSMYSYVFDNPIVHTDPDGRWPDPPVFGGNPLYYMAEGFRQYLQAGGAIVDKVFFSLTISNTQPLYKIHKTVGYSEAELSTTREVTNTTTARTNLEEFYSLALNNKPAVSIYKVTNESSVSISNNMIAKTTANGIDLIVKNSTSVNLFDGEVKNVSSVIAGKAENGAFISYSNTKGSVKTDVGLQGKVGFRSKDSSFTLKMKAGLTISDSKK